MNRFLLKLSVLAHLVLLADRPVQAAITLNAGDVWSHEFTALPDIVPATGLGGHEAGAFGIELGSFESGTDIVRFEVYENSLAEPLLTSAVAEATNDAIVADGAWADFQGIGLIAVESGQVELKSVRFFRQQPSGPNDWVRHTLIFEPVPEPSTIALGLCAAGFIAVSQFARRRS